MSDEDFPTPQSAKLSFSADTLDFDTVITHTASATEQISIYNKNSKGISITSVRFEGEGKDAFLVNVDGVAISSAIPVSIDCRGKDSLIAFVQFNAQDNNQDNAVKSEASLIFTLANGISQSIHLKGYSQDVIVLRGKTISNDTTINASRPIAIYDSLCVSPGATLTIAEGNTLLFAPDAYLKIEGTLIAGGTLANPVVFRGNRYDNMFKNQTYDDIYNQWGGINFTSTSYDNQLTYCDIHAGRWGIICQTSDVDRTKIRIENSKIHNVKQDALTLNMCKSFVGNSQITNAEGDCVNILGGDHTFVHCTIGSFSPFSAMRGNALVFRNNLDDIPYPISRLEFYNSIITGYASDEIFAYLSDDDAVAANYAFYNCLLNTPEIADKPTVLNNVWETKNSEVRGADNFAVFNLTHLLYDFRLTENSPARGIANPEVTKNYYPLDRYGIERGNTPDAGCYQFVTLPTESN